MPDFPETADELTPDLLTGYLRKSGRLGGGRVVSASHEIIGTGKMGDNARVTLSYDATEPGAPKTLIAKLPAQDERARAMAGGGGAYFNEVMFYRVLAAKTEMRTPEIFGSEISADRTSFLLLMEDLHPAVPGNNLEGASRHHTRVALREAAKLASAFYGDESIGACEHVMAPRRDDGGAFGAALMQQAWPGFVDRFGHGLSSECAAFGEHYAEHHAHYVTRYTGPRTLIHADFRAENLLFLEDEATTVDWQTTSEGTALADATYFLGGSVEPEDRRDWERELIEEYRVALEHRGVSLTSADCWEQYREASMHGLMITVLGATYSTPDERSDQMFLTMIQRHLQHCVDTKARDFLP